MEPAGVRSPAIATNLGEAASLSLLGSPAVYDAGEHGHSLTDLGDSECLLLTATSEPRPHGCPQVLLPGMQVMEDTALDK